MESTGSRECFESGFWWLWQCAALSSLNGEAMTINRASIIDHRRPSPPKQNGLELEAKGGRGKERQWVRLVVATPLVQVALKGEASVARRCFNRVVAVQHRSRPAAATAAVAAVAVADRQHCSCSGSGSPMCSHFGGCVFSASPPVLLPPPPPPCAHFTFRFAFPADLFEEGERGG